MAKIILVNDVDDELKIIKSVSVTNPEYFLSIFIAKYYRDEGGYTIEEANIPFKLESTELLSLYNTILKDIIARKFYFLAKLNMDYNYILDIEINSGTAYVTFERGV